MCKDQRRWFQWYSISHGIITADHIKNDKKSIQNVSCLRE